VGAPGEERPDEVRRLGRYVEAARHRDTVDWALTLETLADLAQHGHAPLRPFDALLAVVGQRDVRDVVALLGGCQGFLSVFRSITMRAPSAPLHASFRGLIPSTHFRDGRDRNRKEAPRGGAAS